MTFPFFLFPPFNGQNQSEKQKPYVNTSLIEFNKKEEKWRKSINRKLEENKKNDINKQTTE
jgi:hypothetical protein